jgi:mRNA interferase MazF
LAAGRIEQGEIYWIDRGEPYGSEDGFRRPYVVIQNDRTNRSAIHTIVVCPLTTNLRLGIVPGNVTLEPSDSGLRLRSVVNASAVASLDRARFGEPTGRISRTKLLEIARGLMRLIEPEPALS